MVRFKSFRKFMMRILLRKRKSVLDVAWRISAISTGRQRCRRGGKSVLSRHPVYTMHMRGAAAQGWSAEGLTVTQ